MEYMVPEPISNYLESTKQILLKRSDSPALPILSIPSLNKKIWGLPIGRMTVIGSRTSHGKTSLALQIARDMIKADKSAFYLSFEMTQSEVLERLFCGIYQIDNNELRIGRFSNYINLWNDFEEYMKGVRFITSDGFGKNWQELDEFISELSVKPDVMILDYMQAVKNTKDGKVFIDEYIRHFREICIRTGISGVVISQLNREAADPKVKPGLHHLKGTGFLEELADLVIILDWEGKGSDDPEERSKYIINVAKNRSGKTGYLSVVFDSKNFLFKDKDLEQMNEKEKYKYFTGDRR